MTSERFEELLKRADSNALRDEDMELMRQVFASYAGFFQIVGDRNTTIARLRKMMFGATSEKSQDVLGEAALRPLLEVLDEVLERFDNCGVPG